MKPPTPDQAAPDPYEVLEIAPDAADDAIKSAYLAGVRAHPPERDPQMFKRLRAAYDGLKTPEVRLKTDMTRLQNWPELELESGPPLALQIERTDILAAARALTDLARTDWREEWREIAL